MELIICKNKVALVTPSPLYISLCGYLIKEYSADKVDKNLFASILKCCPSEVFEKLLFCHSSLRIKGVVTQLMKSGKTLEAISLKSCANGVHSRLQTVNDSAVTSSSTFWCLLGISIGEYCLPLNHKVITASHPASTANIQEYISYFKHQELDWRVH